MILISSFGHNFCTFHILHTVRADVIIGHDGQQSSKKKTHS